MKSVFALLTLALPIVTLACAGGGNAVRAIDQKLSIAVIVVAIISSFIFFKFTHKFSTKGMWVRISMATVFLIVLTSVLFAISYELFSYDTGAYRTCISIPPSAY